MGKTSSETYIVDNMSMSYIIHRVDYYGGLRRDFCGSRNRHTFVQSIRFVTVSIRCLTTMSGICLAISESDS